MVNPKSLAVEPAHPATLGSHLCPYVDTPLSPEVPHATEKLEVWKILWRGKQDLVILRKIFNIVKAFFCLITKFLALGYFFVDNKAMLFVRGLC